ncbi:hypothetical protein QE152_g39839 [Popillia japonica]|uniref:Uncharacterized protein n=1 Tax=Popillia japonica TaxID=7064 RepID=A0AAW1HT68_POPJA
MRTWDNISFAVNATRQRSPRFALRSKRKQYFRVRYQESHPTCTTISVTTTTFLSDRKLCEAFPFTSTVAYPLDVLDRVRNDE